MPFHGSDHQHSLRVQLSSGRFVCFACGAWGYLTEARERWREEVQRQAGFQEKSPPAAGPTAAAHSRAATSTAPTSVACPRPSAARPGTAARRLPDRAAGQSRCNLPAAARHSAGARPATRSGVCGARDVAAQGPGLARRPRRLPHTTPDGHLVNLYGRAVGTAAQVPKAKRHDHLPGEKGYFNGTALQEGDGPLWVCEGAFDAAAGLSGGLSGRQQSLVVGVGLGVVSDPLERDHVECPVELAVAAAVGGAPGQAGGRPGARSVRGRQRCERSVGGRGAGGGAWARGGRSGRRGAHRA